MVLATLLSHIVSAPVNQPQAYLDPGSGSFILQLLIASLLGGLFVLKAYWQKIKTFIRGLFSKGRDEQNE